MKLSVIIVNYNVRHFLENCLQSVTKAIKNPNDVEVFIVDNNSVDDSVQMVREKFPQFNLIANTENTGFSAANNQAIKLAHGDYILLLNPDTVIEEDSLLKVVDFMDKTPDSGGLGVKMIDGQGKFLPESKRGLPTPGVALFKMVGLSKLFPKSRLFNQYHLGFLDQNKTHKIDVLSGAFMLLRRGALDKAGLLDETFFMYGEDIDLSYRITKSGYSNYYYPGTTIIHYKGESTKKGSLNYVILFYKAMVIFATKHFSTKNILFFSFLINLAIYFRALYAIMSRIIGFLILPLIDTVIIYSGILAIKTIWEHFIKFPDGGTYPDEYSIYVIPAYILVWVISIYLLGGYHKPIKSIKVFQGISLGTIIILVVYALLPESLRFSRALILLGSVFGLFSLTGSRWVYKILNLNKLVGFQNKAKRIVIVSSLNEFNRISNLLKQSHISIKQVDHLSPIIDPSSYSDRLDHINKLREIISVNNINEVIFTTKDSSFQNIMEYMANLDAEKVSFKIAPNESMHIIGSNSSDSIGEYYIIDINSITKPENIRKKRFFDLTVTILLLCILPLGLLLIKNRLQFISNLAGVFIGSYSWVGFSKLNRPNHEQLPNIKKGILNPSDRTPNPSTNEIELQKLDLIYAKDYQIMHDIQIIWRGFQRLGRATI